MSDIKKPGILKRKGVSEGTLNKVASQVKTAENAQKDKYQIKAIKLSNIELWENQPRETHLTIEDIVAGEISITSKNKNAKKDELKKIIDLAHSTKELSMLVMPLAYAIVGGKVMLIDGHRRTMAAIYSCLWLAEDVQIKGDINRLSEHAITLKLYPKKPSSLTLEKIGMASNALREEIPLENKLSWLIRHADQADEEGESLTSHDLSQVLGLKRSQAFEWMCVVNARKDPWVDKAIIKTLKKTAKFGQLVKIAKADKGKRKEEFDKLFNCPVPDKKEKIKVGSCNSKAIKILLTKVGSQKTKDEISELNLDVPADLKRAFFIFLDNMESESE